MTTIFADGAAKVRQILEWDSGREPLVLELDLTKGVLDAVPQNPVGMLRARQVPTMAAIRNGLYAAATDDDISGLVVDLGPGQVTPTQADELAELIARFGTFKPTIAFAPTYGEVTDGLFAYRLASAANQVWVQPSGMLSLTGVQAQILLLRGGLAKLDLEPEFSQRWEYKTAADTFAAPEITQANRESTQRITDSLLDSAVGAIAQARGLSASQVRSAVDESPVRAAAAKDRNLVDTVGYRDEAYAWVRSNWGVDGQVRLQYVQRYAERHSGGPLGPLVNRAKPAVGVVSVQGTISTGASQPGGLNGPSAGSDSVCAALRAAGRDDKIKTVVLRVDSPGGSYVASDAIRREVLQLRELGKPVVASMGATAASGGYFVAMPCTEIVANPATLTGSIGVLAGKVITQGLYHKLGLVREAISSGQRAGMFAGTQGFTEDQWELLNTWLDEVYTDFTTKAAADRGQQVATLEPMARGRVWTGADAHERGLVDHLGGMDTAIDRACQLAEIDRDDLVSRAVPAFGLLTQFRGADNSEALGAARGIAFGGWENILATAAGAFGMRYRGVLSMPVDFRIS